jgi:hypothetical protein
MSLIYGVIPQITVCFNKEESAFKIATQLPDQTLLSISIFTSFHQDLVFG